jgi:TolB protein
LLVAAPSAQATFPGANGKIAFVRGGDIWTMNPDGSGQMNLTNSAATESSPIWSADGTKIAFSDGLIYSMNADGSNRTQITTPHQNRSDYEPAWSPDGQKVAFGACCPPGHDFVLMTANVDGTGEAIIRENLDGIDWPDWSPDGRKIVYTYWDPCASAELSWTDPTGSTGGFITGPSCRDQNATDIQPSWSPDMQRIVFASDFPDRVANPHSIWTVKPDGTDPHMLTTAPDFSHEHFAPVWSPDGTRIAFTVGSNPFGSSVGRITVMNADGTGITDLTDGTDPDWQPIPINTYPRPKGATPLRVPLVPANKPCTTPNSTHGAPLAYGACGPPQLTSGQLTTGTPDSNGLPVRMDASLQLRVVPGDVQIDAHLNDVFNKSLNDYTGSLRASVPLRITDKDNTPSPGGPGAATTVPFQYGFDIPCTPDPATNIGSDCSISTTADTLVPGTIKERLRTIWQIGRVRVDDAGPDGNPDTAADNTVFAVQGVFVP